ncbi:hypothetical protein J2X31_002216 [Flavobacterium arsenatis]|uniref:Arm DNA-binding domain-containing protein n=1 Tax=Flavobacterium arsenatis TaxID=1484332 RepID=A0ABU1TQM6_9FLAO|nr:hypothetical protein [Flavobacterium arsenatis]MDR6968201.1 hypothetical protein [Flavobacterium arsenatis]
MNHVKSKLLHQARKGKKKGLCPIFAKLSLGNKSTTITTGKLISKERWNSTSNLKGTLRLESEKIVQESLDIFKLNVERKMNELSKFGADVSLELLKTEFQGKTIPSKKTVGIISIIEKHNAYFKKKANAGDRAATSLQKYERAKTLLACFVSRQYGRDEMDAMEIDSAFVFNLESYLRYDSTQCH